MVDLLPSQSEELYVSHIHSLRRTVFCKSVLVLLKRVLLECSGRLPPTSAFQKCLGESVRRVQESPTQFSDLPLNHTSLSPEQVSDERPSDLLSSKSVSQKCSSRVCNFPQQNVSQDCLPEVFPKSVPQDCPQDVQEYAAEEPKNKGLTKTILL